MNPGATSSARRADIERIVRQVLAELTAASPSVKTPSAGGELVLSGKIVSVAELENRLRGVTRVVVQRGAIFTPAARDELRKHQVAIASAVPATKTAGGARLVLGVAETSYEPASLVTMLRGDGWQVERLPQLGLIRVVEKLCEPIVKGGQFGLLITEQTAAALCLANRHRGVRAAHGSDAKAVAAANAALAVNLLVIDPTGKNQFELKQMTRACLSGPSNCSAELREKLG